MIGFLLGAGFSKAFHGDMPVMTELLKMLDDAGKIPQYVPNSVRTDLERTMSYLWTNYPWNSETDILRNRIDYLTLVGDLHKILSEREFAAWHDIFHDGFVPRDVWQVKLAWMLARADRSTVLTMNYDTLLERSMIAANQNLWLLYPAPLQRLYGAWSQQREVDFSRTEGYGMLRPSLYKLHGCLSWYSLDALDENSIVYGLDMDEYYLRPQNPVPGNFADSLFPVIVPPVADKASMYSNKVRSQWLGALDGLRQCDELYCVGYSFPKSDLPMQMFLAQACSKIRTVHLVNLDMEQEIEDRVKSLLDPTATVDWIYGEHCVEEMTQKLVDAGMYHGSTFAESFPTNVRIE